MKVAGKTFLVTGASGGIGAALVDAFVAAGAAEVIAASRRPGPAGRDRVVPLRLDVTAPPSVREAASSVAGKVDVLVNCSGVNWNQRLDGANLDGARQEMDVNYFGLLNMFAAFAPPMQQRGAGMFINILSSMAHANHPLMATYCASKAAAHSLTQAMRAELAPAGVRVMAVFPPAVDTAMSAVAKVPKMAPAALATGIVDAIEAGVEDLYPGDAQALRAQLLADGKAVERTLAARIPRAS